MSILGSLPDSGQLNVASQMVWVGILLEIVEESILLPLYFCFGNSIKDPIETKNKIKTGFIVAIIVYSTFSASTSGLAWPLILTKIIHVNKRLDHFSPADVDV